MTDKNLSFSDYIAYYNESNYSAKLFNSNGSNLWRFCIEPIVSNTYNDIKLWAIFFNYPVWAQLNFYLKNSQANISRAIRILGSKCSLFCLLSNEFKFHFCFFFIKDNDVSSDCNMYTQIKIGDTLKCTFYTYSLNTSWLSFHSSSGLVNTLNITSMKLKNDSTVNSDQR
jgi:hypothetical protein